MTLTLLIWLATFLPAGASGLPNEVSAWPLFNSPVGQFSIRLPAAPAVNEDDASVEYSVGDPSEFRYWVRHIPLPPDVQSVPKRDLLGAFTPTTDTLFGSDFVIALRESVPGTLHGLPTMTVHIQGSVPGRPDFTLQVCIVHRGTSLLAVGYSARSELYRRRLFPALLRTLSFKPSPSRTPPA